MPLRHVLGSQLMAAGYGKWQRVYDLYEKIATGFWEASVDTNRQGDDLNLMPLKPSRGPGESLVPRDIDSTSSTACI